MDNKPYTNIFQDVHRKILVKKDDARKALEERTGKEAAREGFDGLQQILVLSKKMK